MTTSVALGPAEAFRFSIPHTLCLVGEYQYLVGAGGIYVATHLRLRAEACAGAESFSLALAGTPEGPGAPASLARRWRAALRPLAEQEGLDVDELSVSLTLDPALAGLPLDAQAGSPAVGTALAVAVLSLCGEGQGRPEREVAERACRLLADVRGPREDPLRHYGTVLVSLVGGVGYVAPGGERMNVQQLVPPDSLLLLLPPEPRASKQAAVDEEVRSALSALSREHEAGLQGGDEGLGALFGAAAGVLDEGQTAMLYGLLRVREMIEESVERLDNPVVDNDRLAEMCDEESAILGDYYGFPSDAFAAVRQRAVEAGALGAKLTWAFGGCPTAVVLAPGRRGEVQANVQKRCPGWRVLPIEVDHDGLRWGGEEEDDLCE